jgi:hypothetical protein
MDAPVAAIQRLVMQGRRVSVLVPWIPSYTEAEGDEVPRALRDVFAVPARRVLRPALDRLRAAGASVSVYRANELSEDVVARMIRARLRAPGGAPEQGDASTPPTSTGSRPAA